MRLAHAVRKAAPRLTDAELRLVAQIEGQPLLNLRAMAADLGLSPSSVWRVVTRLRRDGAIRYIAAVKAPDDGYAAVTYLSVRWVDPAACDRLEEVLRRDGCVRSAVRLSGRYDYRITTNHADARDADAWLRRLRDDPCVEHACQTFTRTLFDRPNYAAALLGSDHRQAGPE